MKRILCAVVLTSVVLTGFSSVLTAAGNDGLRTSQLRSGNAQILEALRYAYARSTTFRALVDAIESSSDIVYLEAEGPEPRPFRSSLQLVSGNGPVRYLRISVDVRHPQRLVAQLAHELQHATEVVGRPDVVDDRLLSRLYEQIGYRSCSPRSGECWETRQAKVIEQLVIQETQSIRTVRLVAGYD
jgi:hypothetical protein